MFGFLHQWKLPTLHDLRWIPSFSTGRLRVPITHAIISILLFLQLVMTSRNLLTHFSLIPFFVILSYFTSETIVRGQESATATLSIDLANQGSTIAPEMYGQFAEHLGGCVYGGIWVGTDSDIPNINGYRTDVVEALKELKVPVLRWPGGCFADDYHWRDGIGVAKDRPTTLNIYWGGVEDDNSFGTHEFLNLCEMIGCEAYIAGNVGSGTVEEMREWVEYMTSDSNSTMAKLRRENGRDKPWKVRFFGVGNENWQCGGNMTAQYYSDLYRRFATYVRDFSGNEIIRIACGPGGRDVEWMDTVFRAVKDHAQAISMHYYVLPTGSWDGSKGTATGFEESEWFSVVDTTYRLENLINDYEEVLDEVDPLKNIALYVDEWGTWYDAAPNVPSPLYQQNTIRDAVSASIFLNIFHDHADRIRMGNIAQVVNVLQAMILTDNEKMILTPTYHVFELYKVHQGATQLPIELETPAYALNAGSSVNAISATASKSANGAVNFSLTNTDPHVAITVTCNLTGLVPTKVAGRVLTGSDMDSRNTFEATDTVTPQILEGIVINGSSITVTLPPKSVSTIIVQ